ncbi:hypothetical protein VA596_33435 [Amycolatopsis sp., V23-08]|uniref:Uncharacterized protein n=1 Tax=Amycolatopsis heterodermiae TaxID=3110235 RepID=A0ABU5RH47_9PSEU|nr:hypothetical protein [Amycolatopsis sp., V23-08]MEA5364476.1 hypothetical protein [Amycolatopsis sp., V23-08]
MPENGSHSDGHPPSLLSPVRCPPKAPCADQAQETYEATQLSNAETAELVKAKIAVQQELSEARPQLDHAVAELRRVEGESKLALHALGRFTHSGELADRHAGVRRIWRRHENDGPEDRRRRPRWLRWVLVPAVIAAGAFETAFLARIFANLVNMDISLNPVSWAALLPGLLIVTAVLVVGHLLGEAWARARAHSERDATRDRLIPRLLAFIQLTKGSRQRSADDLPWPRWPVALLFTLLVVGTMGIWAYIRAVQAQDKVNEILNVAFALLLLMFTLTAIAVKVISHNPFADAEKDAESRSKETGERHDNLVTGAESAVGRFGTANRALQSLLDDKAAATDLHLDAAWTRILERRDLHGLAGTVAPPFAEFAEEDTDANRQRCNGRHRLFHDLVEPWISLAPLDSARQHLRNAEVAKAELDLATLLDDLRKQCDSIRRPHQELE